MASDKFHNYINYIIVIAIPVMICLTIAVGVQRSLEILGLSIPTYDYADYYIQYWESFLNFVNPYPNCQYPMGFLPFGGLYYIYPLLPKVFFCLIWLFTIYQINEIARKYDVSKYSTIYYTLALLLINPIFLGTIPYAGHYDIIVGLSILLAVYFIDKQKQIKSGISVAVAFLMKFLGLILIFPLVFKKRKVNWRIGLLFVVVAGGVYLIGYFLWGLAVFEPIIIQMTRAPEGGSIYIFFKDFLGIDLATLMPYLFIAGAIFASILLYFLNSDISSFSLIFILGFLMILPTFYVHYGAWFIPLAIYWSITHEGKLQATIGLYHLGGLGAAVISWFYSPAIGALVLFLATAIWVILIFFNRKKDEVNENIENG